MEEVEGLGEDFGLSVEGGGWCGEEVEVKRVQGGRRRIGVGVERVM
jgi:hypothetical protein